MAAHMVSSMAGLLCTVLFLLLVFPHVAISSSSSSQGNPDLEAAFVESLGNQTLQSLLGDKTKMLNATLSSYCFNTTDNFTSLRSCLKDQVGH
jgi:hypothetical protein